MNSLSFKNFIKKIMKIYDEQQQQLSMYTKPGITTQLIDNKIYIYDNNNNLLLNEKYQILSYLDKKTKTWIWSWLIPSIKFNNTIITKELLNYALKLDITESFEHYFIRLLLLNSRLIIKNNVEQDILLGICNYLLGNKIMFFYPIKTKHKIIYYIIYK